MRQVSLLGYELLGGPRVKVETTGRFTPLAALGEEGNAVLRRGIVEEFSSAVEMARELAACVSADGRAVSQPPTVSFSQLASSPPNPIAVRRDVETPEPAHVHAKRNLLQIDRRWILAVALIALCGLGWGLSYYAVMGKSTSSGETIEKQHTVAEQSTVKEEPIATVPETRNAEAPLLSVAVATRASQERSVMVAEPSPTPQAVDQADQQPGAPNGAPAIQANNPQTESSPATSGTPAGAGTAAANGPTEQIPLDARLVGDWDGKPNGSKGGWDRHWEQQSDGSYMMRGVVTESGTLIAHDGKLEKTLDGTGEVVEVLYTFNGNTLMTTEADGSTVVWRQENATPAHSKSSHPLDSKTKHTKHAPQSPGHPGGFWQNLRKYFP